MKHTKHSEILTSERPLRKGADPAAMLKKDHKKVKGLFREFEQSENSAKKEEIATTVMKELKMHTRLEEEIFYPAVRQQFEEEENEELKELMIEALEEHHAVDLLIAELEKMDPEDEHFDAKFIVLSENVKHHIEEEESKMLPKASKNKELKKIWAQLGEQMKQRKEALESE